MPDVRQYKSCRDCWAYKGPSYVSEVAYCTLNPEWVHIEDPLNHGCFSGVKIPHREGG